MPTVETTEADRATRPTNGHPVGSALIAPVPTVRVAQPGRSGPDPADPARSGRNQPDQGDPTRPDGTDPTKKATGRRWFRPGRSDRAEETRPDPRPDPTRATRSTGPKRPDRARRREATESVDAKARRAWLADQGATVGIPRGYSWAFLALVVTTIVSAGSAFWFVFGNVTDTAAMVGVPYAQQRVVSPAIDVIVIGLTVYVQYLVMADGDPAIIKLTRRLLVGASAVMLLMNATPPVLAALTTEYTGPLMRATEEFTPTFDRMTTGQLWGRAALDLIITGSLVAWSHWGPKVFSGLAGIRARSDRAALREVDDRTFATEADRAAAAQFRSEATRLLEDARSEATALVASARSEATALLDQAARDRRAAAAAARSATDTTVEADQVRERASREAEATLAEAQATAGRLRRQLEDEHREIAAERQKMTGYREQLDREHLAARAQIERERDQLADDRRALEDLSAEVFRESATPPAARPPGSPNRPPATGTSSPSKQPAQAGRRMPAAQRIAQGVEKYKRDVESWAAAPPKKDDVMRVCSTYGEIALKIREQLIQDAKALVGASTESN
jgi:hypothetical protein